MTQIVFARAAVVLAGTPPRQDAAERLRQLAAQPDTLLLAADGGGNALAALGLTPRLILGDGDSLTAALFADVPHMRFERRKNFTDGEAALRYACEHCAGTVYVFGAFGGRSDHLLTNLLLPLSLQRSHNIDPDRFIYEDDGSTAYFSSSRCVISAKAGDLLSVVPLTETTGLCIEGCEYPLHDFCAVPGCSRTVSNVVSQPPAVVTNQKGVLLIMHLYGGNYAEEFFGS